MQPEEPETLGAALHVPDPMPLRSAVNRESLREHLNRIRVAAVTGKRIQRRTAKNSEVHITLPRKPNMNPRGLGRELNLNVDVDLNSPCQ